MKKLDIFISGETVDLCIPTTEFAQNSNWYSWFNDSSITRYLEQGVFPNTVQEQEEFFASQKGSRLLLIISTKNQEYKGVVSLSFINFFKRSCDVAIVTDHHIESRLAPYAALEAMALITTHAFEKMGIKRISAGQHILLESWQQRMELLGFKLEGIHEKKFIKGQEEAHSVSIACIYDDYYLLKTKREGSLWDSLEKMKNRIKNLPKQSFSKKMIIYFNSERTSYYSDIYQL
ncbi:N-acetyltransferase [Chlorobium phaeovibrioides]|uniref:GNAT family N-acetyltransferase n=1 Tax=Chlorobium phaeovibrioides TaxID=1094 RepID=UPI000F84A261|nr:GNAT family N-acetyltransferase [Chlorobium phaeovibrioides]RTY34215.1 N-acetyltransferase [Chlorobium phaeovibrioides]